jgi:hypothetical protein
VPTYCHRRNPDVQMTFEGKVYLSFQLSSTVSKFSTGRAQCHSGSFPIEKAKKGVLRWLSVLTRITDIHVVDKFLLTGGGVA